MIADGWSIAAPSVGDWTPLEFVAVIKCLTPEGDIALIHTLTPDLNSWEALGMVDALDACIRWSSSDTYEDTE